MTLKSLFSRSIAKLGYAVRPGQLKGNEDSQASTYYKKKLITLRMAPEDDDVRVDLLHELIHATNHQMYGDVFLSESKYWEVVAEFGALTIMAIYGMFCEEVAKPCIAYILQHMGIDQVYEFLILCFRERTGQTRVVAEIANKSAAEVSEQATKLAKAFKQKE